MARFDTRMPLEQKEFFEYAANLGGFKTLTEFVTYSIKLQAEKIVEKHNAVLASKKDQEVFFNAILNAPCFGPIVSCCKKGIGSPLKRNELQN